MKDLGEFLKLAEIENNGEMGVGISFMGGPGTPATPDEGASNITDVTKGPGGPNTSVRDYGYKAPDTTAKGAEQNPNTDQGHGKNTTQSIPMSQQGQQIIPTLNSWYTSSVHHYFGINDDYEDTVTDDYDL